MQIIPTPKKIEFQPESPYKGQYIIEPLYPGYGLTLGNSLRRVLLSSIPSAAITSVKIKGVDHEFSSLSYVKEDIVDLILNLKQVHLIIEGETNPDEPLTIKIDKQGEAKVTAADFHCPSQVKVINKDLLIATLTDAAAHLDMECIVEKGMGYLPTEGRKETDLEIGHIAIDAIFTPVELVTVETEHVRVGEMTDWDKLVLKIETNGTITCEEAFGWSVNILKEQFSALSGQEELAEESIEEKETKPAPAIQKSEDESDEDSEVVLAEQPKKKRGRPKKEDK